MKNFFIRLYKKEEDVIIGVEIDQILKFIPTIWSDAVLLDNFTPENINRAVQEVQNKVVVEASGGITEASIKDYAMFALTLYQLVRFWEVVDIGLDWKYRNHKCLSIRKVKENGLRPHK